MYAPVNWTGFYVGGFGGALWAKEEWQFPGDGMVDPKAAGYLLGGQAGYNYQMAGPWVVGIEADIGGAGSSAEGGKSCPNQFFFTCHAGVDDLASVTGRLGYAWGRTLFYVKGGLAIGEVNAATTFNARPAIITIVPLDSTTKTLTGWTVGYGAEFALAQNWSAKGEWMYYDLGSDNFLTFEPANLGTAKVDTTGQAVRVGVNYHLGH